MRKGKRERKLSEEQNKIIENLEIPIDMASVMAGLTKRVAMRFRNAFLLKITPAKQEARRKASQAFRERLKEKETARLGKEHSCYNYWSREEVDYIMTSPDPDKVQAKKLRKTIAAIQKKRERELRKRNGED